MRVEIERDFPSRRWKVYVLQNVGERLRAMKPDGEWFDYKIGEMVPPTYLIDDEVWVEFTAAILDLPVEQAPLAAHLKDARQVRDRLLALVEAGYLSAVPPGSLFGSRE